VAAPNVVFVDTLDGPQLLTALGSDRQVPMYEMGAKALGAALYVLLLVFSLIYALVWIIGLLRGRLGERGGLLVRLVPTLALWAPALMIGILMTALVGASGAFGTLGAASPMAVATKYVSYSIPVLGALSLLLSFSAASAPGWLRGFAFLTAAVTFGITAFLLPFGWIGLQTYP
jgi:hypothetical protein